MVKRIRIFRRDETGTSLIEGLIAFPVVLFAISVFVEGGVTVYRYNQSAKAVAVGARLAAVSDPLISLEPITSAISAANLNAGDAVPVGVAPVACGAGKPTCIDAELNRLVYGTDGKCDASIETGVIGMCDVYPSLRPSDVRVTYMLSGLGYVGRPSNPVVSVRVELPDITSDLYLLLALFGLADIQIPSQAVTVTSEDLSSTPL